MPSFLFVCTGNICRSPLAEVAMRHEAEKRGLTLDIDSAGTGHWHIGDPPDPRAQRVAHKHALNASKLRARAVHPEDFHRFTHIIALDQSHLFALRKMRPHDATAELSLMLDHYPGREGNDVEDPYYGPDSGFDTVWKEVEFACKMLATRTLDR
ncbi:low molecular weight protein-tyrosine-phosphatase [Neokomagataea anthophila]|uniref:protein-tyrosine-phosphatase n=1 Tax=Neokomagataea anthophila TaxID=2826925 RepID=A0ABS5E9R6_9PROT|nr:low molecular weight protein-tyrosine-phosphatase [Neokomagataea anthophila]MBR0560243.1 low molecular weight phosphotyrosine protein phosphatase [Neokomagataea anthophila]